MKKINRVRVKFQKFKHSTGKAILVCVNNKDVWFPNYVIKNLVINKKLGGHFIVKTSFLDEIKFPYDNLKIAESFEHHIPKELDISKITYDESLVKKSS